MENSPDLPLSETKLDNELTSDLKKLDQILLDYKNFSTNYVNQKLKLKSGTQSKMKKMSLPGLYPINELKSRCKRMGIKFPGDNLCGNGYVKPDSEGDCNSDHFPSMHATSCLTTGMQKILENSLSEERAGLNKNSSVSLVAFESREAAIVMPALSFSSFADFQAAHATTDTRDSSESLVISEMPDFENNVDMIAIDSVDSGEDSDTYFSAASLPSIPSSVSADSVYVDVPSFHSENSTQMEIAAALENVSSLVVPCLKSIDELQKECKIAGLKMTRSSNIYEIDLIIGDKSIRNVQHYYVKWKHFSMEHNTWEPRKNLGACKEYLELYNIAKGRTIMLTDDLFFCFVNDVVDSAITDVLTLRKLYCFLCVIEGTLPNDKNTMSSVELKAKASKLLSISFKVIASRKKRVCEIIKFSHSRREILIHLKEWETEMNNSYPELPFLTVENDVDMESRPKNFQFTNDYFSFVTDIPDDPLIGCDCSNCYNNSNDCCPKSSFGVFAYLPGGLLNLEHGYPIYECNARCKCGSNCVNRVVQHGQKIQMTIFRTTNGRGWGVRTQEFIKKGRFVLEYVGEIISQKEAEARGKHYANLGRSYLFDLDFEQNAWRYTIDAAHHGNASHFINHSCDPNLVVFAVWINQIDPTLPRLAFFAKKDIKPNEELTFDYKMQNPGSPSSRKSSGGKRVQCKCRTKKCRKYLF